MINRVCLNLLSIENKSTGSVWNTQISIIALYSFYKHCCLDDFAAVGFVKRIISKANVTGRHKHILKISCSIDH